MLLAVTLRALLVTFALLLVAPFARAQAPPPLPLAPGQRIAWDMPLVPLESARTLTYAVYVDDVRYAFVITDVTCSEVPPAAVQCAAHPPKEALADGVHTLQIAVTALDLESKGPAWQVVPVKVPPPTGGRVLP